jgi:hypothetical protein
MRRANSSPEGIPMQAHKAKPAGKVKSTKQVIAPVKQVPVKQEAMKTQPRAAVKVAPAAVKTAPAAPKAEREEKPMSQSEQSPLSTDSDSRSQILRGSAGNVDKIRDILFGSQMRDYEARFARLEETLVKETLEIRETSRRRFDQLESYIKREFETVQARFKSERDERLDVASQHSRELKELGETLSRRIRDLDDRTSAMERDLRSQMMDQAREITGEMHAGHDELSSLLEKRVHELRDGKTDRAALATLFTEVALRLSDQFRIPGSDE